MQISLWAGGSTAYGEFDSSQSAFHLSASYFTAMDTGGVLVSPARRLLGVMESANGVSRFGLTAGVPFAVARMRMRRERDRRRDADATPDGAFDL